MLTFNVKKEWFEKIKSGEKTHEYRIHNKFWFARIKQLHFGTVVKFCLGYPKNNDKDKILYARVGFITVVNGRYTDLKIGKPVYDIEFELIKE